MAKEQTFYELIHPGGPGGIVTRKPRRRIQDKRAKSVEGYAVVFFPKITGIGKAHIGWGGIPRALAQTPEAAIVKFMDGIARNEKWPTYQHAGHRVRKIKILDMGDA